MPKTLEEQKASLVQEQSISIFFLLRLMPKLFREIKEKTPKR